LDERAADAHETDSADIRHGTEADEKKTQSGSTQAAQFNMRKRIRSTTYEVVVHFSPASREILSDKILRLARGEALNESADESGKNQ
jgi:hypothetical protein